MTAQFSIVSDSQSVTVQFSAFCTGGRCHKSAVKHFVWPSTYQVCTTYQKKQNTLGQVRSAQRQERSRENWDEAGSLDLGRDGIGNSHACYELLMSLIHQHRSNRAWISCLVQVELLWRPMLTLVQGTERGGGLFVEYPEWRGRV